MEPDWWLELESTYFNRITQRQDLFRQHGKAILDCQPGAEHACREIMEMSLQFLCVRYPQYFSLNDTKSVFHNRLLDLKTDLTKMHPLHVLLNNVPEDFAITLRNPADGRYYFRAGIACSSLGWSLGTKLGMSLEEIHVPVPDYKERMHFSMER